MVGRIDTPEVDLAGGPWRSLMRPSCGSRRSEMSRLAMIFSREITAASTFLGGETISCITPSMRKADPEVLLVGLPVQVGGGRA